MSYYCYGYKMEKNRITINSVVATQEKHKICVKDLHQVARVGPWLPRPLPSRCARDPQPLRHDRRPSSHGPLFRSKPPQDLAPHQGPTCQRFRRRLHVLSAGACRVQPVRHWFPGGGHRSHAQETGHPALLAESGHEEARWSLPMRPSSCTTFSASGLEFP